MTFVKENLWAKSAHKLFRQVWGNSAKILRTPKNLPAPTAMIDSIRTTVCWKPPWILRP